MSAYIVSDETITAIVMGALEFLGNDYEIDPWGFGQMLVDENYRSVNCRYSEDTKPHKYVWKELKKWDLGICAGCIDCYCYQSCETNDWPHTEASIMMETLRRAMLEKLLEQQGYEITWGYRED